MPALFKLIIVLILAAILAAALVAIWLQRSPRRATLSTLRVATSAPKASAPLRVAGGLITPSPVTPPDEKHSVLQTAADALVDTIATLARRLSPPGTWPRCSGG